MSKHYDGQRWNYRGFIIWCFDGYYDVHAHSDAHPIAEGLSTPDEARAVINEERSSLAFDRAFLALGSRRR
jgi:hypothetical protein